MCPRYEGKPRDSAPPRAVIPIPNTTGNIPVTFAALSHAGTLRLTVLSGPAQVPDAEMLTAAMRQEPSSASGPTGDIDGEPPRAQNTPVCTGTWPLDLDPQAARNGGSVRRGPTLKRLRSVTAVPLLHSVIIVARGSASLSLVRFDAAFWLAAVLRLTRHGAGSLGLRVREMPERRGYLAQLFGVPGRVA